MVGEDVKLSVRDLSISYDGQPALSGVSLDVHEHEIFGIIGPAGSGMTSFLRSLNRMELLQSNMTVEGSMVTISPSSRMSLHSVAVLVWCFRYPWGCH